MSASSHIAAEYPPDDDQNAYDIVGVPIVWDNTEVRFSTSPTCYLKAWIYHRNASSPFVFTVLDDDPVIWMPTETPYCFPEGQNYVGNHVIAGTWDPPGTGEVIGVWKYTWVVDYEPDEPLTNPSFGTPFRPDPDDNPNGFPFGQPAHH